MVEGIVGEQSSPTGRFTYDVATGKWDWDVSSGSHSPPSPTRRLVEVAGHGEIADADLQVALDALLHDLSNHDQD